MADRMVAKKEDERQRGKTCEIEARSRLFFKLGVWPVL